MNFSIKICKQTVNIISPKIHTLFTLYSLTFGSACSIIDTESEGKIMRLAFGISFIIITVFAFIYGLFNDIDDGQY